MPQLKMVPKKIRQSMAFTLPFRKRHAWLLSHGWVFKGVVPKGKHAKRMYARQNDLTREWCQADAVQLQCKVLLENLPVAPA